MHTTGQGYMMAFQASGPHAADRALEAIAAGYEELARFPKEAVWDKPMGKYNIKFKKSWTPVPKGLGLVINVSTWNTLYRVPGVKAARQKLEVYNKIKDALSKGLNARIVEVNDMEKENCGRNTTFNNKTSHLCRKCG